MNTRFARLPPSRGSRGHTSYSKLSNLPKYPQHNVGFKSTSDYLRATVLGDLSSDRRSKSANNLSRHRLSAYTPRNAEDLQEEVMILKKNLSMMSNENSVLKTKIRRMEDENSKKNKELDEILDQNVSRGQIDRGGGRLTVNSLKQKIMRLEQSLKDKEAALNTLKSDMKTTRMQEMRIQMEAFYQDILRLQHQISSGYANMENVGTGNSKELAERFKHLNETVIRQTEANSKLQLEIKHLQEKLKSKSSRNESDDTVSGEFKDMSKAQLVSLVQQMQDENNKENKSSSESARMKEKLNELEAERDKLQTTVKRLKDDRQHFKSELELKDKSIITLKKQIRELETDLKEKDKELKTARGAYRRRLSSLSERASIEKKDSEVTSPKSPIFPKRSDSKDSERRSPKMVKRQSESRESSSPDWAKVELFRKNHAAKKIQKEWHTYKHNKDVDEAMDLIASAAQGHLSRSNYLCTIGNLSQSDEEQDSEAIEIIDAAARAHLTRKQKQHSELNGSYEDDDSYRSRQ